MRNGKRWIPALVLVLVSLGTACDNAFEGFADKESREARLEEARIAQDRGDFAAAVPLLAALHAESPGDAEISRLYASALAGRAGLNFFDLVTRAQDAQEAAGADTIAQLVAAFPHPVTDNNLSDISGAIGLMASVSSSSGDANDFYSLGLYQAARTVLVVLKDTDLAPADGIPDTFDASALGDADAQLAFDSLTDALANLGPGKAGLAGDSDVLMSLDDLKGEIDPSGTGTDVGNKLRAYLVSVF